jgi:hypothetical protein
MAGLGYKVFSAGEVLTAANVNGYLMEQSVMVFAGTAARGSALGTAVAEGMVSYQTDSNTVTVYDGSVWQQVYPASVTSLAGSAILFGGTAVTASMTATSALENGTIWVNGTAAVTVTIPDVLQTWDTITVWRNAGGTVTIAAGTGVTDWAGAGTAGTAVTFKIDQTYNAATVQKVAANTYRVVGKITA